MSLKQKLGDAGLWAIVAVPFVFIISLVALLAWFGYDYMTNPEKYEQLIQEAQADARYAESSQA